MRWVVFISVLFLVLLSGCLDVITTRQKQLCLSSTDFSKTSIPDCNGFSTCFKRIDGAGLIVNDTVPFETKNKILTYKNNIASSVYYFNKAEKEIQKIYAYCSGQNDLKIIKNINDLMFYISRVFSYQDLAWQKSIEILKDYAIFLKSQGVEEITEEEIYGSFVLINQNINELRDETINDKTYIGILKKEASAARELASNFGFLKSYMTSINYVDVYAYYSEYVDNPEQELKIPVISKSSNFVFSRLSTIENFQRINTNLKRTDNYNLYILFDKHIGTQDSLFRRFIILNNKINNDLKLALDRIEMLEKEIENNQLILEENKIEEYKKNKQNYDSGKTGFGYYLSYLKELKLEIEQQLKNHEENTQIENEKISDCKAFIKSINDYNNLYFKNLILDFEEETNYTTKIAICEKLKKALDQGDCFLNLEKLMVAGVVSDINVYTHEECVDLVNQINYNVGYTDELELFWNIYYDCRNILEEIEKLHLDFEIQIDIAKLKNKLKEYKNKNNYEIYLEIEENLNEINALNTEIKELFLEVIKSEIIDSKEIYYKKGVYYLKLVNSSNITLSDFCIDVSALELSGASSLTKNMKINQKAVCFDELYSGTNIFEMDYENKKNITTRIIKLDIEKTLFETIVKNTTTGIKDTLFLGQAEVVDPATYILNENGEIEYTTQKENKILYYLRIFQKNDIDVNFEQYGAKDFVVFEKYNLKNTHSEKVCGTLSFAECKSGLAKLIINGVNIEIDFYANIGKISAPSCFERLETKSIEAYCATDIDELFEKTKDLIIKMNALMNSEFEEVSKESISAFKTTYEKYKSKDSFSYDEIMQILKYSSKIAELEKSQNLKSEYLENTKRLLAEISSVNVGGEYDSEIQKIEKLFFTDPKTAYSLAKKLLEDIAKSNNLLIELKENNYENKINNLKDLAKTHGVFDLELQEKFLELEKAPANDTAITELEKCINEKITKKTKENLEWFDYFKNFDKTDFSEKLQEVEWYYSNIEIKDLYFVKYYPAVTIDDVVRIKKKLAFLDTVKYKEESTNILYGYGTKKNEDILNSINVTTIERLMDLNKEIALINSGIAQIKKDSNSALNDVLKSKALSKNKEVIANIKKDYENKNYLKVIFDSRVLLTKQPKNNSTNYSSLLILGVMGAILLIFIVNKKQPKKLSKEEKKQKILRHY